MLSPRTECPWNGGVSRRSTLLRHLSGALDNAPCRGLEEVRRRRFRWSERTPEAPVKGTPMSVGLTIRYRPVSCPICRPVRVLRLSFGRRNLRRPASPQCGLVGSQRLLIRRTPTSC